MAERLQILSHHLYAIRSDCQRSEESRQWELVMATTSAKTNEKVSDTAGEETTVGWSNFFVEISY